MTTAWRNRVLVIADISASAAGCWSVTHSTVERILAGCDPSLQVEIALLGTDQFFSPQDWLPESTPPARLGQAPSLVAPVMTRARAYFSQLSAVFLIGNGEVFDLPDWSSTASAWCLIQSGDQLLTSCTDFTPDVTNQLDHILPGLKTQPVGRITRPRQGLSGRCGQEWSVDPAGYPLLFIPTLRASMHLFPVTRSQYEVFLARACPAVCGDSAYEQINQATLARVPTRYASPADYEGALMGAVLPGEINAFQAWCGARYQPMTMGEWLRAWQWLDGQSTVIPPAELEDQLDLSALELWSMILETLSPRTLLDLTLMRGGLIEWVQTGSGEWTGMGKPRKIHPFHNPLVDPPLKPTSLTRRTKWHGFRLLRRG